MPPTLHENMQIKSPRQSISAKTAIMSVVFAAMFLLTIIAVYGVYADWENQKKEGLKKVLIAAEDCAAQQKTRLVSTEILLRTLATAYSNFGDTRFSKYIREIDWQSQEYIKISFLNLNGSPMIFPGETLDESPERLQADRKQSEFMQSRPYFQDVLSTRRFTVGEYASISQSSTDAALPMAMPVFDDARHFTAVAMAVLDMSSDDSVFRGIYDEHGVEVIFFDRWQKMLYRYPLRPDTPLGKLASPHLIRAMNTGNHTELFFETDPFGRERTYAVTGILLESGSEPCMYVVASGQTQTFTEFIASLYLPHMTSITAAFALSMLLAAIAGRLFFSSGLERLADRVDAVKSGDLAGRVDTVSGCREIQILAEGMNSMLDSLEKTNTQLQILSNTDDLTGLYNRRHFYDLAEQEMKRAKCNRTRITVAMVDLDFFKSVNDTYGHDGGDTVLRSFSEILRRNLRATDVVARFGGEEFVMLMPETNREGAITAMEKVRQMVSSTPVPFEDKVIPYTISVGVSIVHGGEIPSENGSFGLVLEEALKRADNALYQSKSNGRNQVTVA